MHPRTSVQRHWSGGYSRATVTMYTTGPSCIVHHRVASASSPKQVTLALLSQKLAHLSQEPSLSPKPWRFCRKAGASVARASALPQNIIGRVGCTQEGSVQRHWFGGYSRATVTTHTTGPSYVVHHRRVSAASPKPGKRLIVYATPLHVNHVTGSRYKEEPTLSSTSSA